jgi:septal ring factor EnvC (AmiA/AmiB activator)
MSPEETALKLVPMVANDAYAEFRKEIQAELEHLDAKVRHEQEDHNKTVDTLLALRERVERIGELLTEACGTLTTEAQYHAGQGDPRRCALLQEVARRCAAEGLAIVLHKDHLKPSPETSSEKILS